MVSLFRKFSTTIQALALAGLFANRIRFVAFGCDKIKSYAFVCLHPPILLTNGPEMEISASGDRKKMMPFY